MFIISYTYLILYSSFSPSSPHSSLLPIPIFKVYVSVLTYAYLYCTILFHLLRYSSNPSHLPSPLPFLLSPSPFPFPSFPTLLSLPSSLPILLFFFHHSRSSSFILYVSVLTYTYLYSQHQSTILTPHVLSEWMVEVCASDKYRVGFVRVLCFVLVFV